MSRRTSFAAAAVLMLGSLQAAPAAADSSSAEIVNLIDTEIHVLSNGSSYHLLAPTTSIRGYVRIRLDAGAIGEAVWVTAWWRFGNADALMVDWTSYREDGYHKSFGSNGPNEWDETVLVGVPGNSFKDQVIDECNELADRLRDDDLSDDAIFSKDRVIDMALQPGLDYKMSGPSGNALVEGSSAFATIKLICKKWPGTVAPQVSDSLDSVPPLVEKASLTLLERSGISGVCKVILSGVIETSVPNTKVKFRYKDDDGHQSNVHKVVTDHTGTAMFDHEFDIPNNPDGGESGKIRIVGVSHPFESAKRAYDMDCTAPATNSFEALLPPKLEMQVIPRKRAMVGRQYCVTEVKIVGKIEGRSEMSGEAIFVGDDYYLSPKQAYEVQKGDVVLLGADRELDWSQAELVFAGQLKSLTIQLGFNVTGPGNTIVASLPKKDHSFTCMIPSTDVQAGQGVMSGTPRPDPAPSASRRRLAPQVAPGATTPTAPRQPALRLSPREPKAPQPRLQRQRLRQRN